MNPVVSVMTARRVLCKKPLQDTFPNSLIPPWSSSVFLYVVVAMKKLPNVQSAKKVTFRLLWKVKLRFSWKSLTLPAIPRKLKVQVRFGSESLFLLFLLLFHNLSKLYSNWTVPWGEKPKVTEPGAVVPPATEAKPDEPGTAADATAGQKRKATESEPPPGSLGNNYITFRLNESSVGKQIQDIHWNELKWKA